VRGRYRFRLAVGLLGAILAHIIEVWLFALVSYLMIRSGDFGTILGQPEPNLLNCAYFSFVTYSTLGYGDLVPVGHLRFLAGLEALTGLVLITWTASFMYFQMSRYWSNQ
ncbi:MAG: potassium channel family protein, partial [Gammaproteobacteria bacterium]